MKTGMIIICGLFVVMTICVIPAGAHIAVNDAFTVINSPVFQSLAILRNDIPSPDPSIIDIEYTEKPKHGRVGGLGFDDVGYLPDRFYFGRDSFKYRTYDGYSYSDEATVYLTVVPYWGVRCPPRVWLYTPEDTVLSVDNFKFTHCIDDGPAGPPFEDLEVIAEPGHGKRIYKECKDGIFNHGCFDYIPDAGFEGWDSIIVRPYIDSGSYGYCAGKEMEVRIYVGPQPYPSPEFPSGLLPVGMIIGFIGVILIIQRVREH